MKLFLSATFVFLASMVLQGDGVHATFAGATEAVEYAVTILLNGGKVLPTGETCTIKEWDAIGNAINGKGGRSLQRTPAWSVLAFPVVFAGLMGTIHAILPGCT